MTKRDAIWAAATGVLAVLCLALFGTMSYTSKSLNQVADTEKEKAAKCLSEYSAQAELLAQHEQYVEKTQPLVKEMQDIMTYKASADSALHRSDAKKVFGEMVADKYYGMED